ncbi:MAG TPA: MCP four helix bundle domain-containing protein, partial [Bacillota bacterium]|nr:MCP four helix bundle domain-containing protein [Bacillota bacterium]
MGWFNDLKLSKKLFALSFFSFLIMALIAWRGLASTQKINQETNYMFDNNLLGVYNIEEVRASFLRYRVNIRDYIMVENRSSLAANFDRDAQSVDDSLRQYEKTIAGNTEDRSNFETLKNLLSEYLSVAEKIRASIDQGKKDEAVSLMNRDAVQIDHSIRDQLDKIVAFNINSAKNERVTANQHYRNTFYVLLWISLIGGLLSLAFGFYLAKLITTPVNVVVQCIKRMALGDYTTSIDIHSKDEIGEMASELNRMIDNTEQIVEKISKSSERVGSGSHEIASGNQDLSQRTQEQAATLEEVASSVEEITLSM